MSIVYPRCIISDILYLFLFIILGEGKYFVENIDPTICTHIIYSFAILDGSTYTMKEHK